MIFELYGFYSTVITEPVVYQANKVATAAELGCNSSVPSLGSKDGRFESCKLNFFFGVKNKLIVANN